MCVPTVILALCVQVGLILFKNAYHGGPLLLLLIAYHLLKGNCMCVCMLDSVTLGVYTFMYPRQGACVCVCVCIGQLNMDVSIIQYNSTVNWQPWKFVPSQKNKPHSAFMAT